MGRACCRQSIGATLFIGSYAALYYGLFHPLVTYEHKVQLERNWFSKTKDREFFNILIDFERMRGNKPIPIVPFTIRALVGDTPTPDPHVPPARGYSLFHILYDKAKSGEASYTAPCAILFFGVFLPGLKLVLVLYWLVARCCETQAGFRKWVLHVAKAICRWAAVDACAEAMIVALLLKGGVDAEHRAGYVCYVSFCIVSTISIWIMNDDEPRKRSRGLLARTLRTCCGEGRWPRLAPMVSLVAFLVAFVIGGAASPLASIDVSEEQIKWNIHVALKPHYIIRGVVGEGRIDRIIDEIVKSVPMVEGEASVLEASRVLLFSGHVYTVVGSSLLLVCVLLCPLLQALIACVVPMADARTVSNDEDSMPRRALGVPLASWEKVLDMVSDLCLLDVFCLGMFISADVLSSMLHCELLVGFRYLVFAVLVGYFHQGVCAAACHKSIKSPSDGCQAGYELVDSGRVGTKDFED